jgi:hypothetical protein
MKTDFFRAALACALAACSTPALALHLNPRGLGQALIYPYYTVNKNQDTLVTVVNTSDRSKLVEVSFAEGYNGRLVYQTYRFLSAHDVWSARISQTANDGGARVFTTDTTCTYLEASQEGGPFQASAYSGGSVYPPDGGPTSITRTREGYVKMIAVADIRPDSAIERTIRHVQNGHPNGGVPTKCVSVQSAYQDLIAPSGGLGGSASIVNVGEGTFFAYSAEAIDAFTGAVLVGGGRSTFDSFTMPNSPESRYPGGAIADISVGGRDPITLDFPKSLDALNAVFMADAISNDYLVDSGLGANTDWVLTFPTKSFHVDKYILASGVSPFVEMFGQKTPGQSNVQFDLSTFDHEEGKAPNTCAPVACPKYTLPYEVNVLSFSAEPPADQHSQVLGSALATYVAPYGSSGWAQMNLNPEREPHLLREGTTAAGTSVVLKGLPVVGFMVYNVINSNAQPGKLANYSGLFSHRATTSCSSSAGPPEVDPCS